MSRDTTQPDHSKRQGLMAITLAVLGITAAVAIVAATTVSAPRAPSRQVDDYTDLDVADVRLIAERNDWLLHEEAADASQRTNGAATPTGALAGTVVSQHPLAPSQLAAGETLTVAVVKGPPPRAVPDLLGLTLDEAQEALALWGLSAVVSEAPTDEETTDVAPQLVVTQRPPTGTLLDRGAPVEVIVATVSR